MNLNTITATLLAINIADQRFPNKNIKIVGPGSFTLNHVPRYLKHKVSIFEGNVENYESSDDVLVMVRVLEHIPADKNIKAPIVAITPDMYSTLTGIESSLHPPINHGIQRAMFEIFNQGDYMWDIHKWWTDENTLIIRLEAGEIVDKVNLDGYTHLVSVSEGLSSSYVEYRNHIEFSYLDSKNDLIKTFTDPFDLIKELESEKNQLQIKIWPKFEYMDIAESLYFLWNLYERMLNLNIRYVQLECLDFNNKLDNILSDYSIVHKNHKYKTFVTERYVKSLIETEGYFNILSSYSNNGNLSLLLSVK